MGIERDSMEVDVLIVGAGPSGLATAIHLADLVEKARADGELKGAAASDEFTLMIIEKSAGIGDHMLSGAVLDPKGLDELIPDWQNREAPLAAKVGEDSLYYLTKNGKIKAPFLPSSMHNHGYWIVSLQQLVRWLGGIAEEKGIEVFTGMAGAQPIIEDGKFKGVITDDKGIDKDGKAKSNFEPGVELRAKITVLAEGPRGSMTKKVVPELGLDEGRNPQSYVTGVKELWDIPAGRIKAGTIWHTLGFPLGTKLYGGGWIYGMSDTQVSIGLVTALNYKDPRTDPHGYFQEFKTHPWIASLLKGGKMVRYGAKTISEGGYFAMPKMYHDGLLLVGESAGFLDSQRLKGIHLGFSSGMMAAQTAFDALTKELYSAEELSAYYERYKKSQAHSELWRVRNFHQGYENGLYTGMIHTAAQLVTGGRGFKERLESEEDHLHMRKLSEMPRAAKPIERKFDGELTFDKLTDVYASGTRHEENQPPHLQIGDPDICVDRCTKEYGNPCQYFCPAEVYEMVEGDDGKLKLQINASNCVHCKTCDVADPYGIITWVPPEGGGGPQYTGL